MALQFERVREVLGANPDNALRQLADCVRVVPHEMPLLAPKFSNDAVRVVYDALLAGCRFVADYRSRANDTEEVKSYEVNPLGLVVRSNLLYIVCTLWDYQDIRQLALHRVLTAGPTDKTVTRPDEFNLDEYIQRGEFQYPVRPPMQLKAKVSRATAAHLVETPLSDDQVIERVDAYCVLVTATVRYTAQLEWWLLGFGSSVRVLGVTALRPPNTQSTICLFTSGVNREVLSAILSTAKSTIACPCKRAHSTPPAVWSCCRTHNNMRLRPSHSVKCNV